MEIPREEMEPQEREQMRHDAKRIRAFQELVRTDGWKFFQELLNDRVGKATQNIFEKPTLADARGEDWEKGLCYGLLWARDLPSVTIAAFKDAEETSEPAQEEKQK